MADQQNSKDGDDAVIRVFDEAGNVIDRNRALELHQRAGPRIQARIVTKRPTTQACDAQLNRPAFRPAAAEGDGLTGLTSNGGLSGVTSDGTIVRLHFRVASFGPRYVCHAS
jgi:hypothetical protein